MAILPTFTAPQKAPSYTVPSTATILKRTFIASTMIAIIMLGPILAQSNNVTQSIIITFFSSYGIGMGTGLGIQLLLFWSMPFAQKRGWHPIRGWMLAMLTSSVIANVIYAFVYAQMINQSEGFWPGFLIWLVVGGFITLFMVGIFWAIELVRLELARGRDALIENALMQQELQVAHAIQHQLLPQEAPQVEGVDLSGICMPAREVGGDLLSYQVLSSDRLSVSIGDVTGKSISAAMLMGVTLGALQAEVYDHQEPALVLQELDRWLRSQRQAKVFVALSTALINIPERVLTLANAGQLMPMLLRNGKIRYIEAPIGLPLGIGPHEQIQQAQVQLFPEDVIIFYTDGIVEAQNAEGVLWGFDAFEEALERTAPLDSAHDIRDAILNEVAQFVDQTPQHDDITLIILRMT